MKTCLLRAAGHNASELDHVVVVGARVRLRLLAVRPPRRLLGVEQDVNVLECGANGKKFVVFRLSGLSSASNVRPAASNSHFSCTPSFFILLT